MNAEILRIYMWVGAALILAIPFYIAISRDLFHRPGRPTRRP